MKRRNSHSEAATNNNQDEPLVVTEMNCSYLELFWLVQRLPVCRGGGVPVRQEEDNHHQQQHNSASLLPPEIIHKISSFFTVRPVCMSNVEAIRASSSSQQHPISAALDESESTWWISRSGSMPSGTGREHIEFQLCSPSSDRGGRRVCRLEQFSIKIPPLPMGPLSVRLLRLEEKKMATSWSTADDGTATARTITTWDVISPVWTVENKTGWQNFSLPSPKDVQNIRVVCLTNQMAEIMFMAGGTDMEEHLQHEYASVGFYSVKFS